MESLAGYYASRTGMDPADLLQEAWLAVFEALPTLDTTVGTPSQFLLKHARWQILDHIRWSKRRSCEPLDLAEETVADTHVGAPGPGDVDARMLVQDLERRLNERQRVILKGLLDGRTWRQIGDSMGCTSANVAYHVRGIREAYGKMTSEQ
jgi:RNA polymerase sigma-70 factor (ECF subfamily)